MVLKIYLVDLYDRSGDSVCLTRGSKNAVAKTGLNLFTAVFDISTYKGDTSDRLDWGLSDPDGNPNQKIFDKYIANVLKNILLGYVL